MTDPIPIIEGDDLSAEDKRLLAFFDKLEAEQLTYLDEAGKRVIELSTGMLALLFGVTALGKDFTAPYLTGNQPTKWLAMIALILYLLAMAAGIVAVQPHAYAVSRHGLTDKRRTLDEMLARKSLAFRTGMLLFFVASATLVLLVGFIVAPL